VGEGLVGKNKQLHMNKPIQIDEESGVILSKQDLLQYVIIQKNIDAFFTSRFIIFTFVCVVESISEYRI